MRKSCTVIGVAVTVLLSTSALVAPAALAQERFAEASAGNIDVTRVTLATGGLAEVEGVMDAPGETMRLAIERALVADVLRTLVVTGDTAVRSIDLEAAESVGERSATGRLLAGDLADPATILESLIGETVAVRGGANQIAGRLLAYTILTIPGTEKEGERPAIRIAVATEDGRVGYATFDALSSLAIEGLAAQERVDGVVPALRQSVDDGRRELAVRLEGPAEAGFSFVVPTTVWRPSYRAIVAPDGAVDLQGWATLENTTGLDWNGIDLRLAVGTPVAYRQDVYSPLRTERPAAPFAVGRTAEAPLVKQDAPIFAEEAVGASRARQSFAAPAAAMAFDAAPAPRADLVTGEPALSGTAATIFNVAGAIDLAAGRTLTVPFLDGSQEAERVAFFRLGGGEAPMDALELAFDADATVPGGLIAVYDEAGFVGDARFAGADGGQMTILPFAVSADTHVESTENYESSLASARFEDGALRVQRSERRTIELVAEAREAVTLVVDLDRHPNEEIATSAPVPVTVNDIDTGASRLRIALPAGATKVVVEGTVPVEDYYVVGDIPQRVIEEVLAVGDAIDDATAERLRTIAAAGARIAAIDRRIGTLEADAADLREAVQSDRENLEAIGATTPEGSRVRERIISRTDEIDAMLATLRDLRRERLEEESLMRNP